MKTPEKRPKVIFFDVNETLLDLSNLKKSVGKALGGREELLPLWFSKMLHYSLVMTAGRKYENFETIGSAALQMVAASNTISLTKEEAHEAIVEPLRNLPPHSEVQKALGKLQANGYKLVAFTNSSNEGVKAQFTNAGLLDYFEELLSIEDIRKYKPDTEAYNWAAKNMAVQPGECLMVAAHGWDVAGAIWAGWRSAFISRPGKQLYPLAEKPEMIEPTLTEIADNLVNLEK